MLRQSQQCCPFTVPPRDTIKLLVFRSSLGSSNSVYEGMHSNCLKLKYQGPFLRTQINLNITIDKKNNIHTLWGLDYWMYYLPVLRLNLSHICKGTPVRKHLDWSVDVICDINNETMWAWTWLPCYQKKTILLSNGFIIDRHSVTFNDSTQKWGQSAEKSAFFLII